jgi:predicted nucleotidyltransferase
MSHTSLASALFSNVQQRVLALIFGNPDSSFYTSEIVRRLHSGTGAVERELKRLQRSGLISVEKIGNQRHYRANKQSPIFEELRRIVQKTVGIKEPLKLALAPFAEKIKVAFVFGSVAKQLDTAQSDIDLMVVGDEITYAELYSQLQHVEEALQRPIRPTIFDVAEWNCKQSEHNSFVDRVVRQPKIFILGSETDLVP